MSIVTRGAIAILAVVSAACAPQVTVDTQFDAAVDFATLRTFAWLESDIAYSSGNDDPVTAFKVKQTIREQVVSHLERKGYRQIDGDRPDFYVSYHVVATVEEGEGTKDQYVVFDNTRGSVDSFQIRSDDLRAGEASIGRGTLIVFIVDPQSKRLIWQGTAAGTATTPREALNRSREAVAKIMAGFPPR